VTAATIVIQPDPDACSLAAAERVVDALDVAIETRGVAHWATTGGSAPGGIYARLRVAPLRDAIDWHRVHLWWTDERFVPHDHRLSNAKIALDLLLEAGAYSGESGTGTYGIDILSGRHAGVAMPSENVHAIPTAAAIGAGRSPDWCAERYADELRAAGPAPGPNGFPAFDLVLLGVGPDGHILSVFPGSAALGSGDWALGVAAPTHVEPHVARVTLNPAIVEAAHSVIVVSHGAGKAEILRDVLSDGGDPADLPAKLANRAGATWILDMAAARLLPVRSGT
jgi:6-phosphogluconolactonase